MAQQVTDAAGSMQLFVWRGQGTRQGSRTYYNRFSLNETLYEVGDAVLIYPEDDSTGTPHYVGKIISAFVDSSAVLQDPHCIEIKWFARRTSLEPTTKGIEESEKEVFELDDILINPIGCISGKCKIVRALYYEHAWHKMRDHVGTEWYFCRGYFRQATNSFESYSIDEIDLS